MTMYNLRLAIAVAAALIPSLGWAQHETQRTSDQASSVELTQCLRVQPVIDNIITAATAGAESARLSNSPSGLRAAVDHLEAALRDIRTQLAPCAAAAASTDPHAGHSMPSTPSPTGTPPAQAPAGTADPHARHTTPSTAPASKGADPSKPTAARPEGSKAADPHAGHSAAQPSDKQIDPVNGLTVDSATAPKTTYQGQPYYFSSEQSRKKFLENLAKFAKKSKG